MPDVRGHEDLARKGKDMGVSEKLAERVANELREGNEYYFEVGAEYTFEDMADIAIDVILPDRDTFERRLHQYGSAVSNAAISGETSTQDSVHQKADIAITETRAAIIALVYGEDDE